MFPLLVFLLVTLSSDAMATHYHIVPITSTDLCRDYLNGTCFTLDELSSRVSEYDRGNITLSFLPGEHLLTWNMRFDGAAAITLKRETHNFSNSSSTIHCVENAGFNFWNVQALTIEELEISGCKRKTNGGAIAVINATQVYIKKCYFVRNQMMGNADSDSGSGGAVYLHHTETVFILGSTFSSNSANCRWCVGGAVYIETRSTIVIDSCHFEQNSASMFGGALHMQDHTEHSDIKLTNTSFISNSAEWGGSIAFLRGKSMSIVHCLFKNNGAAENGGAVIMTNVTEVYIKDCYFFGNEMTGNMNSMGGGAMYIDFTPTVLIQGCTFINNSASCYRCVGGAVYIEDTSTIMIDSSHFEQNSAFEIGGAVHTHDIAESSNINITNTSFLSNSATGSGGSISFGGGESMSITHCLFKNNRATGDGGAIIIFAYFLFSFGNIYVNNSCGGQGGAIYSTEATAKFSADLFSNNTAQYGAAISYTNEGFKQSIEINNTTFIDNRDTLTGKGVVFIQETYLNISGTFVFAKNRGPMYIANCQVEFHGTVTFTNNSGESGGAIASIESTIMFENTSRTTISGNTASYGGGLFLDQSTMYAFGPILIDNNRAWTSGAGIYAFQSLMEFKAKYVAAYYYFLPVQVPQTNITNNIAHVDGGGAYLTASSIKVSNSYVNIHNNVAENNGGGLFLEELSKIDLKKRFPEHVYINSSRLYIRLEFINNSALQGGGIYVSDNAGVPCKGDKLTNFRAQQCFLQTVELYSNGETTITYENIANTFFTNNIARLGGNIYGGLLDRCTISPLAEILLLQPQYRSAKGFEYLKATANFNNKDFSYHITSHPVRVCFCLRNVINCNYTHPTVFVKKGKTLKLSVVAVDQVKNPVNASIISSLLSESGGIGRLKEGQEKQHVGNQCTDLQYNAYSTVDAAKIELYADGPCGNQGISKQVLNVTFLPCNCPVGFQRSPSPIDCVCECDIRLKLYVNNCSSENETIQVVRNVWIEYTNSTNDSGYVIQDCPYDYCVDKPVNISLNSPREADKQCAFNRTGNICGKCEEGLSLVFATSKCKRCSNYFLFLLIPFALAGIALVAFILLLNMTVATGTINGLIFYANILAANRSIFLPFDTPNILTVFISWLNMDLGIEMCFYDGMDSYGKLLLQLVFPAYLFFLIGIIITLCEHSQRIATILGKRNPVATLGTLILLSYSKILRTIIVALQYTILSYPDGSRDIVWLYDANVLYFSVSHIPRFLAALIIIILGAVYTILLLFGQTFYHCSHYRIMKWVSHPKYDSFIREYHAPLSPKHRYWVGLLLLARIIHYLISAFASNSVIILSVGIMTSGLVLLKLLNKTIYKNWVIDALETSFLFNLVVMALTTFYVDKVHGDQQALAYTSMTASFVTFLGIVSYHLFEKCWTKLRGLCQRVQESFNRRRLYQPVPIEESDSEDLSDVEEQYYEKELVDYTADNSDQDRVDSPPSFYPPPIIRRAERDDQLREPALDDLSPVRPEDYNVLPPPQPRRQQMTTYTEVDIRADRDNDN